MYVYAFRLLSHAELVKLLRMYLDAEHRNKRKQPFDFTGWEDHTLEVSHFLVFVHGHKLTVRYRIHLNKKMGLTAVSSLALFLKRCPEAWNISTFLKMTWLICASG